MDIRIGGGAEVIGQYLNPGLVDELSLALAPVLLARVTPLFAGIQEVEGVNLDLQSATQSPHVTHLRYTTRTQ